jgi:uncharacterized membrane protein YfcA
VGGGMIIVPILLKSGFNRREAHACAVYVIFPVCVFSTIFCLKSGLIQIGEILFISVFGMIGAVCGSILLKYINMQLLKKIFGFFSIWAALRLLFK